MAGLFDNPYAQSLYQKDNESLADYYSRLASSRKGGILGQGAAVAGKNIVAPTASPAVSAPSAVGGSADPNQGSNVPNIFNPKTEGRGFITDNNSLSTWGQDMALNLMNAPGLTGLLAGLYLDSQMEEMGRQESVYDDKRYGTGTAIVADENGNLNLVDLSKYSSTPAKDQTTLYSGKTGGGVGNTYTFKDRDRGGLFGGIVDSIFGKRKTTWNDLGGYTGVTGVPQRDSSGKTIAPSFDNGFSGIGNDWDNFGGDIARTTSSSATAFPAGQYSDFGFLTGAAKDQEAAERAVSAALATGKDKAARTKWIDNTSKPKPKPTTTKKKPTTTKKKPKAPQTTRIGGKTYTKVSDFDSSRGLVYSDSSGNKSYGGGGSQGWSPAK